MGPVAHTPAPRHVGTARTWSRVRPLRAEYRRGRAKLAARNVGAGAGEGAGDDDVGTSVFAEVPRDAMEMQAAGTDGAARFKRHAKIYRTVKGEKLLFQFGESMRRFEVPEGTRVIYPGVRQDGERDIAKVRGMVSEALENPVGTVACTHAAKTAALIPPDAASQPADGGVPVPGLRSQLRQLFRSKGSAAKLVFAFDDVSLPLPPMKRPDIRGTIMEICEEMSVEEGITDLTFICSIALHRFIRPDEFRHICGDRLYEKYHHLGRMRNFNAVDDEFSVHLGYTRHGEDVQVCKEMVEADLVIYVNVNYVSMDGGYKSYATGMVHYNSLKHNHDSGTLRKTKSLYDPAKSAMHRSFERIGKMINAAVPIFHIETVLDEQLFPWYLSWITVLDSEMNLLSRAAMRVSCLSMRFLPQWLRMRIFWGPLIRAPFGLLQITCGETVSVHRRTLAANYRDKVLEVPGQADILLLAPTALGPYTKDCYMNPLLVNTYALGYWYNMYIDGKPLLKEGGVAIVVSPMEYNFSSPAHDGYKKLFEEVIAAPGGRENFEERQQEFVDDDELNAIYREGKGPAAVHGFYMYTWAAHGMDKIGKVIAVGCSDDRGPNILGWDTAPDVVQAVEKARSFLKNDDASVTYWRCPPVGYVRVVDDDE